jgi:hypothetical protein
MGYFNISIYCIYVPNDYNMNVDIECLDVIIL